MDWKRRDVLKGASAVLGGMAGSGLVSGSAIGAEQNHQNGDRRGSDTQKRLDPVRRRSWRPTEAQSTADDPTHSLQPGRDQRLPSGDRLPDLASKILISVPATGMPQERMRGLPPGS